MPAPLSSPLENDDVPSVVGSNAPNGPITPKSANEEERGLLVPAALGEGKRSASTRMAYGAQNGARISEANAECDSSDDTDVVKTASIQRKSSVSKVDFDEPEGGSWLVETVITVFHCTLYLLTGPALILANKWIMRDIGFHYPMMVSGMGQLSSSIGAFLVIRVFGLQTLQHAEQVTWSFYLRNMGVIGAANASSLWLGNSVYMYLTVSFVQMLKAFTPGFIVMLLFLMRVETPSRKVVGAVLMICVGTAIASAGEGELDPIGLLLMAGANTSEALRLVLSQNLLNNLKFPAMEGLYYMAPICACWMFGVAAIFEMPTAYRQGDFHLISTHKLLFAVAGGLGFIVNISSFLVIKRTSSVLLKLLGTGRSVGLVLFAAGFLGEHLTVLQVFGYAICLTFFGVYQYLKMNKM